MAGPAAERAAQFLATHAVLLLGLGLLTALASALGVILAVRIVARFRGTLRRSFTELVQFARRIDVVNRVVARTGLLIPSAYLGLHLTLGLLLSVAVIVFVALAEDVLAGGEMARFDVAFARALHDERSPAWEPVFSTVSWFGSGQVLAMATVVVALVLVVNHRMVLAIGWLAAQGGGGLLNQALKETFERTRPEFADPILLSSSWSFPSGHAMGTFILCGLGCYLLLRERRSWTPSAVGVSLAVSWCVVMAFSRLYLGVHFASDVIAGLLAGTAWVAVCASAFEVIRRRSAVSRHL
jgi:membrane-associated phospholipid phosphatase